MAGETPPEEFASRIKPAFGTADEFDAALAARGEDADSRRPTVKERAVVQRWAEAKIAAAVEPTDSEVAAWFSENGKSMALPEAPPDPLPISLPSGGCRPPGGDERSAHASPAGNSTSPPPRPAILRLTRTRRRPGRPHRRAKPATEDFAKVLSPQSQALHRHRGDKLGWHLILAERRCRPPPPDLPKQRRRCAALANSRRGRRSPP
ncbi:MAG: hypothetical protein R3F11_18905 [Verrucomicrobiales bacterium]